MVVGEISTGTDVLVIGAGPGGYVAAIRAAQLGKDVTLVEKGDIGGVCLNDGCIPSKALIHAADLAHEAQHSEDLGISVDSLSIDAGQLQSWKQDIVDQLTGGVQQLEELNGVEIVQGEAQLRGPREAHITGEDAGTTINFDSCIIATGSTPITLPDAPFDGEQVISSKEALELEEVPDSMAVIGGGYIGMELGTVYQKLGADVTVLEAGDRILSGNDPEAAQEVRERAEEIGMDVRTGTMVDGVETGDTVTVSAGDADLEVETVLVAIGREPNTGHLGLRKAGVEVGEDGFIGTDHRCKTSASHIYAIGDVADQPMLAHKASKEGKVAAGAAAGEPVAKDYQTVAACVYTDPEIAEVGMSKDEAEEEGYDVVTGSFKLSANGRAMTMDEERGFVRLVATEEDHVLLGATICGPEASDLISELALAIEMGALVEDIALTIHPHPTLSEAVMEAAEDVLGESVHKYRKD